MGETDRPHQHSKFFRWGVRLFVGLCAFIVAKFFEPLTSDEDLNALKRYQKETLAVVQQLTPLSIYNLSMMSMGYTGASNEEKKRAAIEALQNCALLGDNAMRNYLAGHPNERTVIVGILGNNTCEGRASGVSILNLLASNTSSMTNKPHLTGILGKFPAVQCATAFALREETKNKCIILIERPVGLWGEFWVSQSQEWFLIRKLPVEIAIIPIAFAPLAALADVVWHNFLVPSSAAIFSWPLLLLGFILNLALLRRRMETVDYTFYSALLLVAAVPIGTVFFASIFATIFYYLASGILILLREFLDLVALALAFTGAFFLLSVAYSIIIKTAEHVITEKIASKLSDHARD
jgi:hypothetical protein